MNKHESVQRLLDKFPYCSVQGNCLYWRCGRTSERILLTDIDSITFNEQEGKATLESSVGTWFGYHVVLFDSEGASFTEVLEGVTYL